MVDMPEGKEEKAGRGEVGKGKAKEEKGPGEIRGL
jgi:hypothetical protein